MRLVKIKKNINGRDIITQISDPIKGKFSYGVPKGYKIIDDDNIPDNIENKKLTMYYDEENRCIFEHDYSDFEFDDLNKDEQIRTLKEENQKLKDENKLNQKALIELYEMINGSVSDSSESIVKVYSNTVISNDISFDNILEGIKDKVKAHILSVDDRFFDKKDNKKEENFNKKSHNASKVF